MGFFDDPDTMLQMIQTLGGEKVIYKPAGGTPREVWMIVDRMSPSAFTRPGGLPTAKAMGTVVSTDSHGIDPAKLNFEGADLVALPYPGRSSAPVDLTIHPPSDPRAIADDGMAKFELR